LLNRLSSILQETTGDRDQRPTEVSSNPRPARRLTVTVATPSDFAGLQSLQRDVARRHGTFGPRAGFELSDDRRMAEPTDDAEYQPESTPSMPWSEPGILVGVDGSEAARTALEYATQIAPKLGLPLHVLVVWDYPVLIWGDPYSYSQETYESIKADAEQMAADEVARIFPGEAPQWITAAATQGNAARTLVDASRNASMLVVGSRGHGGFAGLLLGSVSSACTAHAHCPVLVVRET
jgi:nucleotide-binding universal stress UspA family protein